MAEIEFEGKLFKVSADGFIPLSEFSKVLFDLSPEDLGFFDCEYRFYEKYKKVRRGLRHDVSFYSM